MNKINYILISALLFNAFNLSIVRSQSKNEVLKYLSALPAQNNVMIGQQCGDGNNIENWAYAAFVLQLKKETGKFPAIIGADYGWKYQTDPLLVNETLKKFAANGGLVEITWHAMNPWTRGNPRDNLVNFDMMELTTPSGAADSTVYDAWMAELDKIASGLQELKDEGIIVLWRPLHEMNGGWFWWGKKSKTGFINVWQHMHNYFTNEKDLDNLIWVYSVTPDNGDPESHFYDQTDDVMYYYPGGEYVDIVGEDIYNPDSSPGSYEKLIAETGKPFALTEYGPNDSNGSNNLNTLENILGKACYWLQWHTWDRGLPTAIIDNPKYDEVMNHEDVITADEITFQYVSEYDTMPPEPPVLNFSKLSSNSVLLSWETPADNVGIDSYFLFKDGTFMQATSGRSLQVEELIPETVYSFTIKARDSIGNFSVESIPVEITTPQPTSVKYNTAVTDIRIYPNPAHDKLRIHSPTKCCMAQIFNLQGKEERKYPLHNGENIINISHYKPGMYYVVISQKHQLQVKKLIIR